MSFRSKNKLIKTVIIVTLIVFLLGLKALLNPSPTIISSLSTFICPKAKYFFETSKPLIALTIDDSPDDNHLLPNTTLGILDILANYEAKATFFVITNKAKEFPQLVRSIVQQGHELGNHLTNDEASLN